MLGDLTMNGKTRHRLYNNNLLEKKKELAQNQSKVSLEVYECEAVEVQISLDVVFCLPKMQRCVSPFLE